MRCSDFRIGALDRELGELRDDARIRQAEHLESCSSCRAAQQREDDLSMELAALASLPAPQVDIVSRVMAAVASGSGGRVALVPGRHVAWATAAAVLAAVAVILGTWAWWPLLSEGLHAAARLFDAGVAAGWPLARAFAAIVAVPWRVLAAGSEAFGPALAAGSRAAPYIGVAIAGGFVGVIGISSFIIARDLRRGRALPLNGDERVTT